MAHNGGPTAAAEAAKTMQLDLNDALELAVGGILAAYLFVFHSSRRHRERQPSEALGPLEHRGVSR